MAQRSDRVERQRKRRRTATVLGALLGAAFGVSLFVEAARAQSPYPPSPAPYPSPPSPTPPAPSPSPTPTVYDAGGYQFDVITFG